MNAPSHDWPFHLSKVGVKEHGRKVTPGSFIDSRRSTTSYDFRYGAPNCSKGLQVPRPSDTLVPSPRHMPGYTSAVSMVGMLGDGGMNARLHFVVRSSPSHGVT